MPGHYPEESITFRKRRMFEIKSLHFSERRRDSACQSTSKNTENYEGKYHSSERSGKWRRSVQCVRNGMACRAASAVAGAGVVLHIGSVCTVAKKGIVFILRAEGHGWLVNLEATSYFGTEFRTRD